MGSDLFRKVQFSGVLSGKGFFVKDILDLLC